MVNQRISPNMKKCVLDHLDQGWTVEDICNTLQVSHASLYCWDATELTDMWHSVATVATDVFQIN